MEPTQRLVCEWCGAQNPPSLTACLACGAPLDVRELVSTLR